MLWFRKMGRECIKDTGELKKEFDRLNVSAWIDFLGI